jgi:FHA domain-containing protein
VTESTPRRSFRPGGWYAAFGERATVLLPPSEKGRVAALWALVDDGAGFDEVLDALIANGLRDLPAFVLLSETDGTTQVVVRGPARATFLAGGEEVTLDGSTVATWVERSLTSVTRMLVEVEDTAEGSDLAIETGLVRVARVDEPAYVAAPEAPEPAEPAEPAGPAGAADDAEATVAEETGVETEDVTGFEAGAEPSAPVFPGPSPAGPPDVAADAEPTEQLPMTAPVPAAWPSPQPAGPPPPAADHDGMTQSGGWDHREAARQQPGIPGQQHAPSVVSRPVARLVLSTGETVDVDRAVIVGRAPEARRFTSTEQPKLVTVPSPHQEISSTHVEIRPGSGADHGSAVVTDMGSTNGTVLVQPGLPPEDLQPGIAVQLIPGAVIDLGDGLTIQVTNPAT